MDMVDVRSPSGEIGTVPAAELQSALQNGFTHVSPEELAAVDREEKYGSTGQQLATAAEGAASAATMGLSTGLERMAGVPAEDIRARREENPGSHMTGQVAGLVGSALIPGAGEVNAVRGMEMAGMAGAKALGLGAAEGALAKIGSSAVKAGIENAVFQGGDEISKMLASDPYQSIETATANIGLSGLLGGGVGAGLGAVSPLWKATAGKKVGQILDAFKKKAGGIEGTIDDAVHDALTQSGIEIPPEIKAGLSNDPQIQSIFKTLQQSDTTSSGQALQKAMGDFKNRANEVILGSFGKTAAELPREISKFESGKLLGETVAKEVDEKIGPLAKEFEALKGKAKDVDLVPDTLIETEVPSPNELIGSGTKTEKVAVPGTTSKLAENVAKLAEKEGWTSFNDSEIMGLVNKVMSNLPKQKTLKNLTNFITQVGSESSKDALNFEMKRAGQLIKNVLRDGESEVVVNALGKEGPELVGRYQAVREAWKEAARITDMIDDRLKIGGSTSAYAKNIRNMAKTDGEAIYQRLSGKGDADLLNVLQENFPQTAEALKQQHLTEILKHAADKAAPGEAINTKALLNAVGKMSPELRNFAVPMEALQKSAAVGTLLEQFAKSPHNFSNTARTMDKLFQYIPGTAVGMAAMVAGSNPALALIMGGLTKALAKDAPDAIKLALLKFMASGQPIEAGAFKATVDMIQSTMRGEAAINRAVRNVYKSTRETLPSKSDRVSAREKLDKKVRQMEQDPERMLAMGGESGYYLPEHATAMADTAGRVIQYLGSVRPAPQKNAPLDDEIEPSKEQIESYDRALDIADNPLSLLEDIKGSTLLPSDVGAMRSMYPALYDKIAQKLTNEMIDHMSGEEKVPYKLRQGLSLFLGQPLDSTFKPEYIQAAQATFTIQKANQQQQGMPGKKKKGTSGMSDISNQFRTADQSRQIRANKT